jgi:hypothetical protein
MKILILVMLGLGLSACNKDSQKVHAEVVKAAKHASNPQILHQLNPVADSPVVLFYGYYDNHDACLEIAEFLEKKYSPTKYYCENPIR